MAMLLAFAANADLLGMPKFQAEICQWGGQPV
jgi:hypothetical protein